MTVSSVLLLGAFAYTTWGVLLFVLQHRMMYPGASLSSVAAERPPPDGVETVRIPFSGGTSEAWFLAGPQSAESPALIFAHGNAEIIDYAHRDAVALSDLGAAVLLVEYPGYRQSDGRPSRETIGEVFVAAYDWLASRPDIDRNRIAGMGRSLGSGAIGDLSLRRPLKAVILQSPFASVAHFARAYLLPSFLVRDNFDNVAALRRFSGPVLLVHGRSDATIPFVHSQELADVAERAELVGLDCGHNDCPPNWAQFVELLRGFLNRSDFLRNE